MKHLWRGFFRHILNLRVICLALSACIWSLGVVTTWGSPPRLALNPYEGVDWAQTQQIKAGLHAHTTESDGSDPPERMIDAYHRQGFGALALTDHNRCTWPWERWGRDGSTLNMLAIPGNELSRHHHAVSLFVPFETSSSRLEVSLKEVADRGGLVILAHPGRYWKPTPEGAVPPEILANYLKLFAEHDVLVGMEVINFENRYPHDRLLWDGLLTKMMPGRPVWGFANDDAHSRGAVGRNWVILLLSEVSLSAAADALSKGRTYFATLTTHDRLTRDPAKTPRIERIWHDEEQGVIHITATVGGSPLSEENCSWISDGTVVHKGSQLPYRRIENLGSYVRAELRGPGGTTFTQPFGLAR